MIPPLWTWHTFDDPEHPESLHLIPHRTRVAVDHSGNLLSFHCSPLLVEEVDQCRQYLGLDGCEFHNLSKIVD
jgi:hypothetical protein